MLASSLHSQYFGQELYSPQFDLVSKAYTQNTIANLTKYIIMFMQSFENYEIGVSHR